MKTYLTAVAISALAAVGFAQGRLTPAAAATVCVQRANGVNVEEVDRAEVAAGKIFALIDLHIDWRNRVQTCPMAREPILLSITTGTPDNHHPGAFGVALPYEGIHTRIFYDRVQRVRPDLLVPVLAHVLARDCTRFGRHRFPF